MKRLKDYEEEVTLREHGVCIEQPHVAIENMLNDLAEKIEELEKKLNK
jgi:hypothetical protein